MAMARSDGYQRRHVLMIGSGACRRRRPQPDDRADRQVDVPGQDDQHLPDGDDER